LFESLYVTKVYLKDFVKNLVINDAPIPPQIHTAGANTKRSLTITLAKYTERTTYIAVNIVPSVFF